MENFIYETPTKVYFGKDQELEVGRIIKTYDVHKVLIHYGGKSAKESGLLDRVKRALEDEQIDYVEFGGVVANPELSLVREGIELCRREGVDFVLAVGGVNPTGRFVIGGPAGDTGLTGRKIIVDTYGGYFSHGGGAFSGKDPTKVDRSAAYMARYMAKNLVAAGLAEQVEVQLAYAIGVAQPVSVRVNSYGTGKIADEKMTALLRQLCDLTPGGIIRKLDLRRPIYAPTAAEGHFGIEDRPWERTDIADQLKALANG